MADELGLGLRPGDMHYRAYVGPPEDYDLIAAMTFCLFTSLGLRQQHTLLDIGCGSLRVGRLFLPYLNSGNYFGIEPNEWLVREGINHEVGESLVILKKPIFHYADNTQGFGKKAFFDFALAQSIFSHAGPDIVDRWLSSVQALLKPTGALLATFCLGVTDNERKGWMYPECVTYSSARIEQFAQSWGFRSQLLDWKHPRQQWALFAMPEFKAPWITDGHVSWNAYASFLSRS